jgi:hypothetical protein
VETIVAVEDVAEVPLVEHLLDVEVTMVTTVTATAMANQKEITNSKMVLNLRAGGATSMDIVKKIVASASKQMPHAKASMAQPTGLRTKPRQLERKMMKKKFKEQLVVRKNFEHYHRWKTALCQGQSEWLRKKLFV